MLSKLYPSKVERRNNVGGIHQGRALNDTWLGSIVNFVHCFSDESCEASSAGLQEDFMRTIKF